MSDVIAFVVISGVEPDSRIEGVWGSLDDACRAFGVTPEALRQANDTTWVNDKDMSEHLEFEKHVLNKLRYGAFDAE